MTPLERNGSFMHMDDSDIFDFEAMANATSPPPQSSHSSPVPESASFAGPSHEYNNYSQQTIPLGEMNMEWQLGDDSLGPFTAPPVLFPNMSPQAPVSMNNDILSFSNDATMPVPAPQQPERYYSGIHSQMAMQQQAQRREEQKIAHQQREQVSAATSREMQRNSVAPQFVNCGEDPKIDMLLRNIQAQSMNSVPHRNSVSLPHIQKLKKEEEEMDEDERLLASEEGKKLSSKERRQLRNKVSARAFRSRRKEYISQLEGEVQKKTIEAQEYQKDAMRYKAENEALLRLSKALLSSPQFHDYVSAMNPANGTIPQNTVSSTPASNAAVATAPPMPQYSPNRDVNPNGGEVKYEAPQSEDWTFNFGLSTPYPNHQVYACEIPEPPAIQDLSGKLAPIDDAELSLADLPACDGFFPHNNEKSDLVDYCDEVPENLMELWDTLDEEEYSYEEEEYEKPAEPKKLDELFGGLGVTSLLDNLELVATGKAALGDVLELDLPTEERMTESTTALENCAKSQRKEAKRLFMQAEKVYRNIDLLVGGE